MLQQIFGVDESKGKESGYGQDKIRQLTRFSQPKQPSTAYDIALLSHYAMQNSIFKEIVSCRVFESTIKVEQTSPKRKINNFYEEHS
jgi:D-alanyl-D-alanine carboxypeptidase